MIELRLLGAQSVRDPDGNEVLSISAQPKRLALLTYLALASDSGDGFVSRDELLALFWPEADDEHARNALNQHLYRLRAALGSEALPSHGTNRVGVDGARVWCDATEFRAAIARGEPAAALDLYAGELLPGFHVSGSPEFEKWFDNQRFDFRRRALSAALALGHRAAEASDPERATAWYLKAREIAPESDAAAAGLAIVSEPAPPPLVSGGTGVVAEVAGNAAGATPPREDRTARRPLIPSGAVLLGMAVALGWLATTSRRKLPDPEPSVAILPVVNLTGEASYDHLADLIHDDVIQRTGARGDVQVISRTSAMAVTDSALSLPQIGRLLGAESIVESTLRMAGDSLHLTVRLLDAGSERSIWEQGYTSGRRDTTYLVVQMPRSIANEIRDALSPDAKLDLASPRLPDPAALAMYVRGQEQTKGGPDSLPAAIESFDRATELDPQFAAAWAALGHAWQYSGGWAGRHSPVDAMTEARNAYDQALALDSTLAEAYAGIAAIEWLHRWRWAEAERAYLRSIELNPNDAGVRESYGNFLRSMRRVDEGVVQLEKAVALDPLGYSWAELSIHYQHLGRFDESRAARLRARELHPDNWAARIVHAFELWEDGYRTAAADTMAVAGMKGFAAWMYAGAGAEDEARMLLAELESAKNRNHLPIAHAWTLLGDTARALDWLELGVDERHAHMVWLNFAAHWEEDGYEPLFPDVPRARLSGERFEAILDRMNFPDPPAGVTPTGPGPQVAVGRP